MTECPSSEELARFAEGGSENGSEALQGLEAHLDECPRCRAWLDDFFRSSLPTASARRDTEAVPRHLVASALAISRGFEAPPDAAENLPRGLGDYELLEVIGRGGMGVVYRALDRNLRREVALKVLAPSLLANPEAVERFQREARAAAALQHENVLPIHAIGGLSDESDAPYLVMPLVRGESLEARLRRGGSPAIGETLDLARQIAAGLSAAHEAGIIHRDIKPANILLEEDGKALIADFGLARIADDASLTLPDARAGTPHFMAPEQANGEPVGPATDLFCFGAVLYRMLSGALPFDGDSTPKVLHALATSTPEPLRKVRPEVPAWLSLLVESLLEKNPADRPGSARAVADMLATESAPGQPSRRLRRLHRRLVLAGGFVLALGAFLFCEWSGRSDLVNAGLSAMNGQAFSIRGKWGTHENLDRVWASARDGDTIEVRLRGDLILRPTAPVRKALTIRGRSADTGRLVETGGDTVFHGRGDFHLANIHLARTAESGPQKPLLNQEGGTLALSRCTVEVERAFDFSQYARREILVELTDARLVARDSVLNSASTYLIHARGGETCELALENCGLRGFSLLVLDQEAGARCALTMHHSTLAVLGCLLSPRGRAFPETSVTGSRNLLRCGTLAWKSDGSGSTLDAVEWRMGVSVIGGLRAPFGRDSTIRQMAPDRDSAREKFTARWPDAARTIHFVDDLGLPGLQEQNLTPDTFSNGGEWSEYGYRR